MRRRGGPNRRTYARPRTHDLSLQHAAFELSLEPRTHLSDILHSLQSCVRAHLCGQREAYLNALDTFQLEAAFPDINPQYYGFRVDPFEPSRVWFHSRSTATHTGPLLGKPPTGKKLTLPPQLFHLDFSAAGKVREIGFYVVDRRQGNTGGLGGAFGYFYGTGNPLPIPECAPYKPSKRFRLLNAVGRLGTKLKAMGARGRAPSSAGAASTSAPQSGKVVSTKGVMKPGEYKPAKAVY